MPLYYFVLLTLLAFSPRAHAHAFDEITRQKHLAAGRAGVARDLAHWAHRNGRLRSAYLRFSAQHGGGFESNATCIASKLDCEAAAGQCTSLGSVGPGTPYAEIDFAAPIILESCRATLASGHVCLFSARASGTGGAARPAATCWLPDRSRQVSYDLGGSGQAPRAPRRRR